jgi:hypothetical protein
MSEPTPRRVLVACRDADGIPALYPALVAATDEEVAEEGHYRSAQKQTREHGYELPNGETICIDAKDAAHGGFEDEFSEFFATTDPE